MGHARKHGSHRLDEGSQQFQLLMGVAALHGLGSPGMPFEYRVLILNGFAIRWRESRTARRHCTHSDLVMPGGRGSAQDTVWS